MYKLIVSDFDNVLIDDEEAIAMSTIIEIDRVRQLGVLFGIVTWRELSSVLDYNRDFPFMDYIVCCNGAYIYDVSKGLCLYKKSIGIGIIKKINKMFSNYNLYFYTRSYCNYLGDRIENCNSRKIDDFDKFLLENKKDIYKVEIGCNSKKDINNIIKKLEDLNLNIEFNFECRSQKYYIYIVMKGIDRFSSVEKVCKTNKISLDEVMAFCSGLDDLELIKNVGCGVAISNACSKVKKSAREVSSSNNDRGVERIIKKYF